MTGTLEKRSKSFEGWTEFHRHDSKVCGVPMGFSVYRPPQATGAPVPVLYWLSGLTCTEENFMAKAGAQQYAARHGIMIVCPDTSPRGTGISGEDESYDFGTGAGFYVNATRAPWNRHYRMYDYVSRELPELIEREFPVMVDRRGVFGHSMGGHGALVLALSQPGRFRSVSAFAPICAPSQCAWGIKAFRGYLGDDKEEWARYDANELIPRSKERLPILIDQGTDDQFLAEQLKPDVLQATASKHGYPLELRMREGYDHSYYFIASFMEEHISYHAGLLKMD